MKTTLKIVMIAAAFSVLFSLLIWSPPQFSRWSIMFFLFLFALIPMAAGQLVCRTAGPDVKEWSLLGVIIGVFLMWANLGVLIGGSATQSIPIVVSNIAVTNLAATHPDVTVENSAEFKLVVYQYFSDELKFRVKGKFSERVLSFSPILLGFFVFMFFSYLGFKLARSASLRDSARNQAPPPDDGFRDDFKFN